MSEKTYEYKEKRDHKPTESDSNNRTIRASEMRRRKKAINNKDVTKVEVDFLSKRVYSEEVVQNVIDTALRLKEEKEAYEKSGYYFYLEFEGIKYQVLLYYSLLKHKHVIKILNFTEGKEFSEKELESQGFVKDLL